LLVRALTVEISPEHSLTASEGVCPVSHGSRASHWRAPFPHHREKNDGGETGEDQSVRTHHIYSLRGFSPAARFASHQWRITGKLRAARQACERRGHCSSFARWPTLYTTSCETSAAHFDHVGRGRIRPGCGGQHYSRSIAEGSFGAELQASGGVDACRIGADGNRNQVISASATSDSEDKKHEQGRS